MIQTNENMEDNEAKAIISFDYASGSALFTGGYINQAAWLDAGESMIAHVGRINTSSRSWVWSKLFSSDDLILKRVAALAIDPLGTKLACFGESSYWGNLVGFIFVLDPESGLIISDRVLYLYKSSYPLDVTSRGFIITTAGVVYWAENSLSPYDLPNDYEQKITLGAYDSSTHSLVYSK